MASYAGQALEQYVVKSYIRKESIKITPEWTDLAVASVITIAGMLSPVRMMSFKGVGYTFLLGILARGIIEGFRDESKRKPSSTKTDNTEGAFNLPELPLYLKNLTGNPKLEEMSLANNTFSNLSDAEKVAYNTLEKDQIIDNSKLAFDITYMAKFGIAYYNVCEGIIQKDLLKKNTIEHINNVVQMINDDHISSLKGEKAVLSGLKGEYEKLLQGKASKLSDKKKKLSEALDTVVKII